MLLLFSLHLLCGNGWGLRLLPSKQKASIATLIRQQTLSVITITFTSLQCLPVLPYFWTDAHKSFITIEITYFILFFGGKIISISVTVAISGRPRLLTQWEIHWLDISNVCRCRASVVVFDIVPVICIFEWTHCVAVLVRHGSL